MQRIAWPTMKRQLVAILRGIKPDEALDVVGALIEEGFEAIEIPLNSPDPFISIGRLVSEFGERALIGAGTVLTTSDVEHLAAVGGRLVVSPNICRDVVELAVSHSMITMPGVLTPSEAHQAINAGASGLKFFPASVLGPDGIKAIMAILPPEIEVGAVGGVGPEEFQAYAACGIRTFGLGSSIYRPGASTSEVRSAARRVIAAYDAAFKIS